MNKCPEALYTSENPQGTRTGSQAAASSGKSEIPGRKRVLSALGRTSQEFSATSFKGETLKRLEALRHERIV